MSKVEVQNSDYGSEVESLSEDHRQYLIQRHGTADLSPIPQMDDADPLNWAKPKKLLNISLVAFHAFVVMITAAAPNAAFVEIAEDLNVSIQRASYLTSLSIAILGGAPIFWRPLANTYGRRPIFLMSLLGSLVGNVGCAVSHSYAAMGLCRAIVALFICPPASIGSGVVSEMFFRKERGQYMGIWAMMISLGVPVSPLIFGFVADRVGYRWIFWTLAIANGAEFVVYFFLGSETRYEPATSNRGKTSWLKRLFEFRRIDPKPITWSDFFHSLVFFMKPCVALAAAAYAMVFMWASVMTTVEIPQLFPVMFGFNDEQVGLQNISLIVGTIVGELIGGFTSDKWMLLRQAEGGRRKPEFRLWLSHIGYLLTICGIVVFLVQLGKAGTTWNVTPLVGSGIAAAGNQIVTTVMITYAVDCYPNDGAAVGVFITFVRQIWGFIGPFWFPQMIADLGFTKSIAVPIAMIAGVSIIPTLLLQWKGNSWRK